MIRYLREIFHSYAWLKTKHLSGMKSCKTFEIQLLPDGESAIPNGSNNLCLNDNAVLIYGVISGQPGWTESYGWLYEGKWMEDFYKLVAEKKYFLAIKEKVDREMKELQDEKKKEKELELLNTYK